MSIIGRSQPVSSRSARLRALDIPQPSRTISDEAVNQYVSVGDIPSAASRSTLVGVRRLNGSYHFNPFSLETHATAASIVGAQ
ncbi:hypothetical protein PM082_005486 [Marasmius tenuissimus]|nr:hypothetical protein PM082_005486 [Marasmius tenuissimus]